MVTSTLNDQTAQYEVRFESTGTDVLHTKSKKTITVFGKAEDVQELDWVKIGYIGKGNVLTQLNLTEGLIVKLSCATQFVAASTNVELS